jgi:hypothetical protein
VGHFRGEILADNPTVRQLLIDLGAELHTVGDGQLTFDVAVEHPASGGLETTARQVLRAASGYLVGVLHRLHPPS